MKNLEHTFAICAYKESPYLEETILSLKSQKVKSDIFIATSTPSEFLDKISKKYGLQLLINKETGGIYSDWNFAYNNSNTKYVTLAHQDDLYLPEYTQTCLEFAGKYKDNLITFTQCSKLYKDKVCNVTRNLFVKDLILFTFFYFGNSISSQYFKKTILSFGNSIPCPTVMFNKENIGNFHFSDEFSINLDWNAWVNLAERKGTFVFVKKRLLLHRIHDMSETVSGIKNNRRVIEDEMMLKKLWPLPFSFLISYLYSLRPCHKRDLE
jgi:glycosyltransferase involved in cell wall biosynthesis